MEHIYSSVYAVKKRLTQAMKEVSEDSDKLQAELQQWRSSLPADLDFDASRDAGLIHLPFKLSMLQVPNQLISFFGEANITLQSSLERFGHSSSPASSLRCTVAFNRP
jgi:hypothetical protein